MQNAIIRSLLAGVAALIVAGCAAQRTGKMDTPQLPPKGARAPEKKPAETKQEGQDGLETIIEKTTQMIQADPGKAGAYIGGCLFQKRAAG